MSVSALPCSLAGRLCVRTRSHQVRESPSIRKAHEKAGVCTVLRPTKTQGCGRARWAGRRGQSGPSLQGCRARSTGAGGEGRGVLSRLVITFLPRSKCLLIPWLQSPSTVILEPKKIKSVSSCIVPVEGIGGHVAQYSIIPYSLITVAYAVNRGCVLLPTAISPTR